jgi:RecB family exonuclease
MATIEPPTTVAAPAARLYRGGPGAGKTELLLARAREACRAGLSPDRLVCLTLDQASAHALQQRFIQAALESPPAVLPQVWTYESLARQILGEAAGEAALRFLDPLTERLLVGRALAETAPAARYFREPAVRESPRFRDEAADFIAELKRHKLTPERFQAEILPGLPAADALADLAAAYQRYQELLQAQHVYDLRGLLWLAREALAEPGLRAAWRERFALVLADDLQEATPLHLELLAALIGPATELVATYEPAETIYGFRGALGDPRPLLRPLLDRPLTEETLQPAETAPSSAPAQRFLTACQLDSAPPGASAWPAVVTYAAYRSREEEFAALAAEIVALLNAGACRPEELAIITRTSEVATAAAEPLLLRGVPVAGAESADQWQARQVLGNLLAAWTGRQPLEAGPGARLAREQAGNAALCRLADLYAEPAERGHLPEICRAGKLGEHPAEACPALAGLREAVATAADLPPLEALLRLAADLLRRLPEALWQRLTGPLTSLLAQMTQTGTWLSTLSGGALAPEEAQALLLGAGLRAPFECAGVAVLTAHESRGRHFRRVFLAGLQEEAFPQAPTVSRLLPAEAARALRQRARSVLGLPDQVAVFLGLGEAPGEALREEARLFYTCLTRAEERLSLSCHLESCGAQLAPSPFLAASLPESFALVEGAAAGGFDCVFGGFAPEAPDGRDTHEGCLVAPCARAADRRRPAPLRADCAPARALSPEPVLAEVADSLRLSPSQLENYLRCPRRYFLSDLLRVLPQEDNDAMVNGETVHALLRALNDLPPHLRTVDRALPLLADAVAAQRERFSSPLAADMYAQMDAEALRLFLSLGLAEARTFVPEKTVELALDGPDGARHFFGGRLDVAEWREDAVAVVDYKTGEIESARGLRRGIPVEAAEVRKIPSLQVQLPLYALAWEQQPGAVPVRAMCLQNFSVRHDCARACVALGEGGKPEETLTREDLGRFAALLVQWAEEIQTAREFSGCAPEEGCRPHFGGCPFAEVCDAAELS